MASQLERIAQDLVGCLDQVPAFAAELQRTATEMRAKAAHAAGLMRIAEQIRHAALISLQAAGDDYAARASASHSVEQATRAIRACQVAAQVCDFAANRCDEAAHYAMLAPPQARTWAASVIDGAGSRAGETHPGRRPPGHVTGPNAEPNTTQTRPKIAQTKIAGPAADTGDEPHLGKQVPEPNHWDDPDDRKAWVNELVNDPERVKEVASDEPWASYQRRHAGNLEIKLIADDSGDEIWADGLAIAPDTVVAVEAKYVARPDRSMYEGNVPERIAEILMQRFDDEMRRYGKIVQDEGNPIGRLRIVTSTDAAARYLGDRARRKLSQGIDIDVQVRPEGDQ